MNINTSDIDQVQDVFIQVTQDSVIKSLEMNQILQLMKLFINSYSTTNLTSLIMLEVNYKRPEDCKDITEVRNEIDNIDIVIIKLLRERFEYVKEVVKYKDRTSSSIEASDRRAVVLNDRRKWAEEAGLDPDVIEELYSRLIQYFIEEEKKLVNLK